MLRKIHTKVIILGVLLAFCLLIIPIKGVVAQNKSKKNKVGCPEKWWAMGHPFVAKKAYSITRESLTITDSIQGAGILSGSGSGDQVDAFKHAYWMAALTQHIGSRRALKLGKAHEKSNYRSFKKSNRKGTNNHHDKASSDMDLWNNREGSKIGNIYSESTQAKLIQLIVDAILDGQMRIIKKNQAGEYLDARGQLIAPERLSGTWDNGKTLVPSQ